MPWLPWTMSFRGFEPGPASEGRLPVATGDVVAGKYRVERVIGSGGMGIVVAATHLALGQLVALKFMRASLAQTPGAAARFVREARAAAQLRTEHVTRVLDVSTLDDGTPFIVFEYLDGRDLADHLAATGPLAVTAAVDVVLEACDAIAEAHAVGIVHRDLKPQNLFLARRADGTSCVKVMDFGISKVPRTHAGAQTGTAELMGSPLYMSPEQMCSPRDVDARADLWALGAILYELLAGRAAFDADTMPQICAKVLDQALPPLRAARPGLPTMLELVVERCLEKDPARRYASVAHLALALSPFASEHGRTYAVRVARVLGVDPMLPAPARSEPPPRMAWEDAGADDDPPAIPMTSWWPRVGAVIAAAGVLAGIGWARDRVRRVPPRALEELAAKVTRLAPSPHPSAWATRVEAAKPLASAAASAPLAVAGAAVVASASAAVSASAAASSPATHAKPSTPASSASVAHHASVHHASPAPTAAHASASHDAAAHDDDSHADPAPYAPEPLRPLFPEPEPSASAPQAEAPSGSDDPYEEADRAPGVAPSAPTASAPGASAPSAPGAAGSSAPGAAGSSATGAAAPSATGSAAPSAPGTSAPSAPGTSAPSAPGSVAPSAPGTSAPGATGSVAPSAPGASAPSAPGASAP